MLPALSGHLAQEEFWAIPLRCAVVFALSMSDATRNSILSLSLKRRIEAVLY